MQIWTILFQRLQAAKTARFVRGFLVFLSHYVVKRGPAALQASTDTVQPGIFLVILQQACARPSTCAPSKLLLDACPVPPSHCMTSSFPTSIHKFPASVCSTSCPGLANQCAVSE